MPVHIDIKYINMLSPRLERFGWKKQSTLAACRCPICGDSEKSKSKVRFYFYEKKGEFYCKCHNCGFGSTLGTFIHKMDEGLSRQYRFEVVKEKGFLHASTRTPVPTHAGTRREKDAVLSMLDSLSSLPKEHPAVEWATQRKIPASQMDRLYYSDDYGEWAKNIDPNVKAGEDPRIVIPIIDRDGKVVGAQGRILPRRDEDGNKKPDRSTIRYLTVKADKDTGKQWFGLDRCDPKEPIIVVEGPIDSLFLPNAVAMVGLSDALNIPKELEGSQMIFALDNEPRNKEVVQMMERLMEEGFLVCVWSDKMRGMKDINDMVLAGMNANTIAREIERNAYSGLSGLIVLRRWAK
jgi:hypothetical protein